MLILRNTKGSPLTYTEMDNNLSYLEGLTVDVPGTNYVVVKGTGTPTENGTELEEAYATTKTMSPAADNRITVVVFPGEYGVGSQFTLDTSYIDLVSVTGNRDVNIFRTDDDTLSPILIDVDNVYVKGLNCKESATSTIPTFEVSDDLPNITVENCKGGAQSFGFNSTASGTFTNCIGGDVSFGGNNGIASGTFTRCKGDFASFGGVGIASGTFTDCVGGNSSFGDVEASGTFTNCIGGFSSFCNNGIASGTFTNCTAGETSFGSYSSGIASGTFTNCVAEGGSFGDEASGYFRDCIVTTTVSGIGGFGGINIASGEFINCSSVGQSFGGNEASGYFKDCKATGSSFGRQHSSGTFIGCEGGDQSFSLFGNATGEYTNCIAGEDSFGAYGTLSGKLYFCRLTSGTFPTVTGTGRVYTSIDGNGDVNNQ